MIRCSLLALLLLTACGGEAETGFVAKNEEAALTKAQGAARELMTRLVGKLKGAMDGDGTLAALEVCATVAQEITEQVRSEQGVYLRRTALKVRNPENAADDYERAWLEKASTRADLPPGGEHEVVSVPDGGRELRYMRPIRLQALCVQCHGDPAGIAPEVKAAIEKHYPDDKATGYSAGDLRGVVSVRVRLE